MKRLEWLALFCFVLLWRLCHSGVLWIEEAYPMAGAIQILNGRMPYADFWFDKPPLTAFFYALWGAVSGVPLRIVGALYVTLCAWLASRMGGRWAAWLLAVYLSLGIPSAVMAIAPDLLLVAPHLAAVWMAQRGHAWRAGLLSGVALLVHTKGVLVLAAALLWCTNWRVAAGFAALLPIHLALGAKYWEQVWEWGRLYSGNTFVKRPWLEGLKRTGNWIGFHATAVLAAFWKGPDWAWRWWAWVGLGMLGVVMGARFFPRYYFFLLVPFAVMGGKVVGELSPRWRAAALALLLIPTARFGPRNIKLAMGDESWDDLALFRDSKAVVEFLATKQGPNDTLFVWGYRPDVDALSRIKGGTPYLEAQPIDCVFADRHLTPAVPMKGAGCEERARGLGRYEPTWIVDGLGPLNPRLRIEAYFPLKGYELAYRTNTAVVYRLVAPRDRVQEARLRHERAKERGIHSLAPGTR